MRHLLDNQNSSDMDVYVIRNGQRLGDGRIRLQAQPVAAAGPIVTPLVVVPAGQTIFWTIGSDPTTSTAYTG